MICFRDTTWCASSNCTGECGHKMTPDIKEKYLKSQLLCSWAYFCDGEHGIYKDIKKAMKDE